MSFIVEAALSGFFQILIDKIASSDLLRFVSDKEVCAEIDGWKKMLDTIRHVLDDAEEKQMNKSSVKDWTSDLKDLAYDAEDILDEFATESLRQKLEGELEASASTSKVRKLLASCCVRFSPSAVMFNSEMASKIKDITNRFQAIKERGDTLDLKRNVGGISGTAWQRPLSSCLHDEPQVYGRDDDKRKILSMLLKEDAINARPSVLTIVGMGGLGKTTLARLVYNDESLQNNFHPKAWVCVSEEFDITRITKAMLESITKKPCKLKELNEVQLELHKELKGKKFLIVLDDVWSARYADWNALRPPFMDGAPGCKIIVTTRIKEVAQKMGTVEFHQLERIRDDDCWMLFSRHAFENTTISALYNLEVIRKQVINKCNGLPLAARTLGGLLRSKSIEKWEDVLNNDWSLEGDYSDVLGVLRLSYYHLPSHLKRCFGYCAIFPRGYEFMEIELVLLWMAEGLIQQMDDCKQMEEVGSKYFHDLLSRSLFQRASNEGPKFVMHDLVNDLAQSVAGETCLRLEDVGKQFRRERVRHFSYIRGEYDVVKKFQLLHGIPKIRTFLPLSLRDTTYCNSYMTSDVLTNLLPKLRCLRALSFKGYKIYELPDSVGELEHLRYLDLSFTKIRSLPESTISLCNLQTLLLRSCRNLKKLPSRIENLKNLCYLDIEGACLIKGLPLGVKELVSLRSLSMFPVSSKADEAGLTDLNRLNLLQKKLCISGLEKVNNSLHGREMKLKEKRWLKALLLKWDSDIRDECLDEELLDRLQPHVELEELQVRNYGGMRFPYWVREPSFTKLVSLRLENCRKCTRLPRLGWLPSLRELLIKGMSSVKSIGSEFYGEGCSNPFPALETLHFQGMSEWEDWNPGEFEFPCLNELIIENCHELLGKLPSCLPKLKRLEIMFCPELVVCLPSLPMVLELKIWLCKEVDFRNIAEFGSPNNIELRSISKFTIKTEGLMEQLCRSKRLAVEEEIFPNFRSEVSEEKERLASHLEKLDLWNCESFIHLAHNFISLSQLTITSYPKLVSLQDISFPSNLRVIKIEKCNGLMSLHADVCLEELVILRCDSLVSISRGNSKLFSTLKRLKISHCKNLQGLLLDVDQGSCSSTVTGDYNYFVSLEFLSVDYCPSFTSLSSSRGDLQPSLQEPEIYLSNDLRFLPKDLHRLVSLRKIFIHGCPNFKFLPKDLDRLGSLQEILIFSCDKFEGLPDNIHNIASLQELYVEDCPAITSFPKEGFPTNLIRLQISDPIICKPLFEWGLHKLTNLTFLEFSGGCTNPFEWGLHKLTNLTELRINGRCSDMVSFPCNDVRMVLPPSLTSLDIRHFPKLRNFEGFENLTSLEFLSLFYCPKLTSFPKNGLPRSLLVLYIGNCPLLEQRCLKDKGQEWFKIAHIPSAYIDGKHVLSLDEDRWS